MKLSHLALLFNLWIVTAQSYRLLEAQAPAVTTITVEKEIPWEDENPDLDVMIPEQSYVDPPKRVVQEVIEVEAEPEPVPAPVIAVVALTPEQFDKLKLENRVVEVESVGSAQDGGR